MEKTQSKDYQFKEPSLGVSTDDLDNSQPDVTADDKEEQHQTSAYHKLTKKLVFLTYFVIIFTALVESFAQDSTSGFSSYATSSFNKHSLIATAQIVYKITAVLAYPVLGKIADLIGRAEGFGLSVFCYTLCYVIFAACQNVQTYIAGEVFFAIGRIGFKVYLLIFIADTTNLLNRGLWSQFPAAITGIPSTYAGSYIQDAFLDGPGWRWGYGAFAIILGVSVIPLVVCMYFVDRILKKGKSRKQALILVNIPPEWGLWQKIKHALWYEIDLVGFVLLLTGLILFFLPFSITGKAYPQKWSSARTIVMLVIGFVCIVGFIVWCSFIPRSKNSTFRNINPFIPLRLLNDKTIIIAFLLTFLDYTETSMFSVYFLTALQVGGFYTAGEATRIDNAKKITIDIASIIVGALMRFTKRSKIFVIIGVPSLILGQGLLVWFMNRDDLIERTILLYVMEIITGVGRAFYTVPLLVMVQGYAGAGTTAMSTAFYLFFNIFGSLVGTAIAGGVWNTVAINKLTEYLPEENKQNATAIFANIKVALSFKEGTAARTAISLAYRETEQLLGWIGLGMIGPMLILMWFVQDMELTDKHDVYGSDEDTIVDEKEEEGNVTFREKKWWQIW